MAYIGIWAWLIFFLILSFTVLPWWFFLVGMALQVLAIWLDRKNKKKRERMRRRLQNKLRKSGLF